MLIPLITRRSVRPVVDRLRRGVGGFLRTGLGRAHQAIDFTEERDGQVSVVIEEVLLPVGQPQLLVDQVEPALLLRGSTDADDEHGKALGKPDL